MNSTLKKIAAAALCTGLAAGASFAQTYPSKPVRVIVPFAQRRRTGSRRGGWCWGGDGALPPGLWHRALRRFAIALVAGASLVAAASFAQSYPSKPVRVIVPFAPGGGSDITARVFSSKLSEYLGQQFVVDNRGGAAGLIGMELTARAPADGYVIMMMSASFSATSAVQQARVRSDQQHRGRGRIRLHAVRPDRTPVAAGEDDQGADRARAHDERRLELCRDRDRRCHAPCHRALLEHGEDQDGRHSVQEHRCRDGRSAVGAGAGDRGQPPAGHAASLYAASSGASR